MSVVPIDKSRIFVLERIVMECFADRFGMQYGHVRARTVNTRRAGLVKQKKRTPEMGLDIDTD